MVTTCTANVISIYTNLFIVKIFKWLVSYTPYLIHDSSITPHITGTGILLEMESLMNTIINRTIVVMVQYGCGLPQVPSTSQESFLLETHNNSHT